MKETLVLATTLGISGVTASFLLFFILVSMHLPIGLIQAIIFAKLIVAGHGTIYNTRTRGWFWEKPYPSWLLFSATLSTRILGTIIAVYGFFFTPIGWETAGLVWAYALVWLLINDVVKKVTLHYYRKKHLLFATTQHLALTTQS